ncbi:MAG: PAS domain-containing sensor histidine kinase [Prolixibacteraceae bacterium]
MSKPYYHIVTEKLWASYSPNEKKRLFELLVIATVIQLLTLANFIQNALTPDRSDCFICSLGLLIVPVLTIICLIRGKANCALNTVFTIPLFLYAYYISDFNSQRPLIETVHHSMWWLLPGLLLLFYYSKTDSKIILFFLLAFFTLIFQLIKANRLPGSFYMFDPVVQHPLVILTAVFTGGFLLRTKYNNAVNAVSEELKKTRQGISKSIQESHFAIAELKAERDEAGNIEKLLVEKVNHAFESSLKKHLHEVQGQEAGYVFGLAFKEHFDLNKFILFKNRKTREFHAKKLDRWYKIHIVRPEISRYYVFFEDISKIKEKIARLESSRKRYKVLLEAIPDMFFIIGKDGVYEDFVIKESDLFKIEDANVIGSTIYDVGFPESMAKKIHQLIQISIKNNSIETIEYSLNTPNGTYLYEMRLAKLNARSVISIARDITKRKTAEINLEKARKKAEESDRLKSAFLSNLSHEIRTPLNIITNFTRILAESELEHMEKLELSDAISQNGKQLLNMIDNTIHLSKIETDSVDVKISFCKINTLMRDVYIRHRPLIPDSKNLKISFNIDVPNTVFGFETDSHLLKETLEILLDNAIKFTPEGEVMLAYKMIGNEKVRFIISDTGIGIPQEEKENIFSRFYRANNEINELSSGSGLGLPIAQHYVMLLGGELQLESKPGKGTTFWFELPFREGKGYLRVVS